MFSLRAAGIGSALVAILLGLRVLAGPQDPPRPPTIPPPEQVEVAPGLFLFTDSEARKLLEKAPTGLPAFVFSVFLLHAWSRTARARWSMPSGLRVFCFLVAPPSPGR